MPCPKPEPPRFHFVFFVLQCLSPSLNSNVTFPRSRSVGGNGVGKTTFLKLLAGELLPDSGTVSKGSTVNIGHFDQRGLRLDSGEEDTDLLTFVKRTVEEDSLEAMRMLNKFLFPTSRWQTRVKMLSGGEKRRLQLMQIVAKKPNVLLFDEPSNDLDLNTLLVLEDFIVSFPGVVVVVSHDLYFLTKTVETLFVFLGNGKVRFYQGSMREYLALKDMEKEDEEKGRRGEMTEGKPRKAEATKSDRLLRTNSEREKKKIEAKIEKLSDQVAGLQKELDEASSENGWSALADIQKQIDGHSKMIEELEERWYEIEITLENLES